MLSNTKTWDLIVWERECCGGTIPPQNYIYAIFNELAIRARQQSIIWWHKEDLSRSTLFGWRDAGIAKRDAIKVMIAVLRRVASLHRQSIFSDETIYDDVDQFINSMACRHSGDYFFEPPEIEEIRRLVPVNQRMDSFYSLHRRVYPAPPENLRGRGSAIKLVKESIKDNLITVVGALAGQGKTALAWHISIDLVLTKEFVDFDWTTHKYNVIDVMTGMKTQVDPTKTHDTISDKQVLDFDDILLSMAQRFNWLEVRALDPLKRQDPCAELLANSKYLIVIDNIETLPDLETTINYFSKLQGYGLPPLRSRILITSRHVISAKNVFFIDLDGIERDGVIPFFEDLGTEVGFRAWSDEFSQQLELWHASMGNPLLMMIAFYRLTLGDKFDEIIDGLKGLNLDFELVFHNMFGEFLSLLHPSFVKLAQFAAESDSRGEEISYTNLNTAWVKYIYPEANLSGSASQTLLQAIHELTKYRILTPVGIGEFSMHSLIRTFLRR